MSVVAEKFQPRKGGIPLPAQAGQFPAANFMIYIAVAFTKSGDTAPGQNREVWGPFTREGANARMHEHNRRASLHRPGDAECLDGYGYTFVFLTEGEIISVIPLERDNGQWHPYVVHLRARDGRPNGQLAVTASDVFNGTPVPNLKPGDVIDVPYQYRLASETVERVERKVIYW